MANDKKNLILLVEDDVPLAMRLNADLVEFGYPVMDFVTHGSSALTLAEKDRPILALIDIGLPDMDGICLAKELRERFGTRTIFITGDERSATFQRALESCPLDYLIKPISTDELREAIEWALLDLNSIADEMQYFVAEPATWMDTPLDKLGGKTPRQVIGTPRELELRRLLRAVVQGMPT